MGQPHPITGLRFGVKRDDLVYGVVVTSTLITFVLVDRGLETLGRLPLQSYAEPSLVLEQLRHIGGWRLGALLAVLALLARNGQLLAPWSAWQEGPVLRLFVILLAAAMVWPFSTYGFNYLFGQGHHDTRVLLVLTLALLWWRPVFVLPLLALLYTVMGQLSVYPLGGSILAHKLQVLHVLNLFAAAWLVHAASGRRVADAFWLLAVCLVGGAYWVAFVAKMKIGWLSYGHLYHALPSAWAHGWLGFLDAARIVEFTRVLQPFDLVLRVAVLVFEGGCLLMLVHRRVAVTLLGALVMFHAGVFAVYGFLFWTWMLLDAAMLAALLVGRSPAIQGLFNRRNLVLSMLLILFAGFWARPPQLGWYDTRVNYTYKVDAALANGQHVRLAPQFFAPYEDVFTMASFGYLNAEHPLLVGPYGVSFDRQVAEALREPADVAALLALEQRLGKPRHDASRAEDFAAFIRRFVANRNASLPVDAALYALAPPRQFWSFDGTIPPGTVPITAITVVERTTYFDDRQLSVVREQVVAQFDITASPPAR